MTDLVHQVSSHVSDRESPPDPFRRQRSLQTLGEIYLFRFGTNVLDGQRHRVKHFLSIRLSWYRMSVSLTPVDLKHLPSYPVCMDRGGNPVFLVPEEVNWNFLFISSLSLVRSWSKGLGQRRVRRRRSLLHNKCHLGGCPRFIPEGSPVTVGEMNPNHTGDNCSELCNLLHQGGQPYVWYPTTHLPRMKN